MVRVDGRKPEELRPVKITRDYIPHAEGSVLIELGNTKVVCTASWEERVPQFLKDKDQGWITAEYAMLPRATVVRTSRASSTGRPAGRTFEIQRMIGRSLRAVADLAAFPRRTVWIDCDVIQADGGTRTAAITGADVALRDALDTKIREGELDTLPLTDYLAAVSVGIVSDEIILDLCFEEDVHAQVDLNLVATSDGSVVEVQGTAEKAPVPRERLEAMIDLGLEGIVQLIEASKEVLSEPRQTERK